MWVLWKHARRISLDWARTNGIDDVFYYRPLQSKKNYSTVSILKLPLFLMFIFKMWWKFRKIASTISFLLLLVRCIFIFTYSYIMKSGLIYIYSTIVCLFPRNVFYVPMDFFSPYTFICRWISYCLLFCICFYEWKLLLFINRKNSILWGNRKIIFLYVLFKKIRKLVEN